ncbi:MAG: hypothetical protein QXW00_02680 [Candidatus Woesearchaeota archaeon]
MSEAEGSERAEIKEAEIVTESKKEEEHKHHSREHVKVGLSEKLKNAYLKNYRRNFYVTVVFAVLLLIGIAGIYLARGELFRKDISLKGGVAVTLSKSEIGRGSVLEALQKVYPNTDVNVRELQSAGITTGLVIESSELSAEQIIKVLEQEMPNLKNSDYTVQIVSPALGASVFRQIIVSIVIAFALMALTVFLYFRIPIPSLFVVMCAFLDVVGTIFVISIFDMRMSTAGISALLVLIGYSVTTDILLTARALKGRYETLDENIMLAFRTGMDMTLTTIIALLAAYFIAESELIKQIMLIMLIGLCFDMIFTWFMNVGILRMYLESKGKTNKKAE